ncbi:MAG: phage tail protein [Actinomycetota bacterium]|nr:phage tail protein [Actinomycetota bacterium]
MVFAPTQRALIPGLPNPFPLRDYAPSMLAGDPVTNLFLDTFDEVLAPIISTLDCYHAYLDADLAPMDFIDYMSTWLLVSSEQGWTDSMKRQALAKAVPRSRWRGTTQSISDRVTELFGGTCDVTDSGDVTTANEFEDPSTWSAASPPRVTVTFTPAEGSSVKESDIRAALQSVLPAHVELVVTVVT